MKRWSTLMIFGALLTAPFTLRDARSYPTDEYERTGIRRLKVQNDINLGLRRGTKLVSGAKWPSKNIKLRMLTLGHEFELSKSTPKDVVLQSALEQVLKKWSWRKYNVALIDITDPAHPRYAGVNEQNMQTPGSVAKVLVASALFEQLKSRFPKDIAARENLLKTQVVIADDWAQSDSHEVPVVTGDNLEKVSIRRVHTGDSFSLWEWIDHALSPSNNSAAATVWREATLMKLLGEQYPPPKYDTQLWSKLGKDALTEASFAVVDKPLLDAGISPEDFKLRLYFTHGAGKYIHSSTCGASVFAILQWMVRVEQGRMVDEWSSLELKKMLYLTRRRVRYLHTHLLDNFAAFFKSGSLYRFNEGSPHIQYEGDKINVLNSLIEIDTSPPPTEIVQVVAGSTENAMSTPAKAKPETFMDSSLPTSTQPSAVIEKPPYVYIVAVMSNELKRNAAMDHARLAEAIHSIITATPEAPAAIPDSPDAVKVPDINDPSEKEKEPDEEGN